MKTEIALKNLIISPRNVRIVSVDKNDDKQLIASIASQGLLQNLVVIDSSEEPGKMEVVAGGRRYSVLKHLEEKGSIDGEYPVPCLVTSADSATEVSLAENLKASMHPADIYVAYKALSDQGRSIKDIASRFGRSQKDVKRLLKLGGVAPEIIEAFRADEMSLDAIMAFTVSDDHEKQVAVYNDLNGSHFSGHTIKRRLINTEMTSEHSLVKFVTIKAYEKAGGTTNTDLFQEVRYIDNPALVESMAMEKLESVAGQVAKEGWHWVEVSLSGRFNHPYYHTHRIDGSLDSVPSLITERIATLNQLLEDLNNRDYDDWTDKDSENERQWEEEIEELENQMESFRAYTDEQKSYAGAVVTIDNGEPLPLYGFVRKEDIPKTKSSSTDKGNIGSESVNGEPDPFKESNALKSDLTNYKLQALQSVLMNSPNLCADLTTFTMASSILGTGWYSNPVDMRVSQTNFSGARDIDQTQAANAINAVRDSLNIAWLIPDDQEERFLAFQGLSRNDKKAIHAYCIAVCLTSTASPIAKTLAEQLAFNLADHWQPTKDNYFGRINKGDLVEIGRGFKGDGFAEQNTNTKKSDLAAMVEAMEEIKGWLPPSVAA